MNKKVCGKCGNYFDDNLVDCPFCSANNSNEFNIPNLFLDSNNTVEEKKESVINNSNTTNNIVNNVNSFNTINNNNTNNAYDKYEGLNKINYEQNNSPKSSIIIEQNNVPSTNNDNQIKTNNTQVKKRKKKRKINELFSFLLLIQGMILLFIVILSAFTEFNIIVFCHYILTSILLTMAFNFCYRNKNIGIILSLVASISMICMFLEGDYVSAVIGIYILTFSFVNLLKK